MRIARWKTCLLFSLLLLPAAAGAGGEAGLSAAALLADPDDLVVLDESPAVPGAADVALTPEAAVQNAFPVFYGTLPVTAAAVPPPVPPTVIETAEPAPPAAPVVVAAPVTPVTPVPAVDPVEFANAALDLPVPLPPPAELLEGAAALPAARGAAEPVPSIGATESAARALDGTPLPPPLPELAAKPLDAAPAVSAPSASTDELVQTGDIHSPPALPRTLDQVRAEFAALKTYCEADSLGSAAEIYARMPDFGGDEEMNRLRADAANLLILGLARSGNLMAARRIYDSVPTEMAGFDARLAKARAVINLATYCIRAQQYNDAFAVLMDVGKIQNRSALNNELFRLMARMIPYLDNAEETEKARRIFDLLLSEVKSPGTAALFAENVRASVLTYYFHYVDNSDSPVHRRVRLDFLEHMFIALDTLAMAGNDDILALKRTLGNGLSERYAGDPERASQFEVNH